MHVKKNSQSAYYQEVKRISKKGKEKKNYPTIFNSKI